MREYLAHFSPILPVFLEGEWGPHQISGCELGARCFKRQRLAIEFVQHRLVIEAIDRRKPALQENYNDVFGFRRGVWGLWRPGIPCDRCWGSLGPPCSQSCKRCETKTVSERLQGVAAR